MFSRFYTKNYEWNEDKNNQLKQERNISFEEVVQAIQNEDILDIIETPNSARYPEQYTFILRIRGYVYCVPFVENENFIFLKTIFPNRKMKKRYLGDQQS